MIRNKYILSFILLVGTFLFVHAPNKLLSKGILVTATVYQGVEAQTNSEPTLTASMNSFNPTTPPKWIAVSRDLLELYPYGTKVKIYGAGNHDGIFKVMDTMNKRKVNQIDILIPDYITAGHSLYGKWDNVILTKI